MSSSENRNSQRDDAKPATCGQCGASIAAGADRCWLCRSADPAAACPASAGSSPGAEHRTAFQFSLATMMLFVTFSAVLMGVFSMAPGVGVVLFILSAPALIRTCLVAQARQRKGRELSAADKTKMYLGSVGVGLVIVSVLAFASFAAFFVVCLGHIGLVGTRNSGIIVVTSGVAAFIAALLAGWPLALWVRRRWRKAVGDVRPRQKE